MIDDEDQSSVQPATPILEQIRIPLERQGFKVFGHSPVQTPPSLPYYDEWLSQEHHGDMEYLATHRDAKAVPQTLLPNLRTILSVAVDYWPHPKPATPLPGARVALYAQGEDYHFWLKQKLHAVCEELQQIFPEHQFRGFTDSAPLLERDLAQQAGLGWVGKNTCLIIRPTGSLFFLAEILTTLDVSQPSVQVADFCGTCTKCLDICPTQALTAPRVLDARRCISYLTIESKQVPAENLRVAMQDWLFGCDLCQTVCPWNQKALKLHPEAAGHWSLSPLNESTPGRELEKSLRFLLQESGRKISKLLHGSPLQRAGAFGLRRNALIVAANRKMQILRPEIRYWTTSGQHQGRLQELAAWALRQIET